MFLSMRYDLLLLQLLFRTVNPYSAQDYSSVLEVRLQIPQSASISFEKCSPEDIIVPQCVSQMHPTYVQLDLNQGNMLTNPFQWYLHFSVAREQQESGVVGHCHS